MGLMNGKIVHYRAGDICHPLLLTDDGHPNYNQVVSGLQIDPGPLNEGASFIMRVNVDHDTLEETPLGNAALWTDGTWHQDNECRDAFSF
jgi:hypothetical protein